MSYNKCVLVGYSGHALVVGDVALSLGLPLSFYTEKKHVKKNLFNLEYIGFEASENFKHWSKGYAYLLGIGSNIIREKTAVLLSSNQQKILTIHDSTANISKYSEIGIGCFIAPNVNVNAMASVKDYCILNTGCIVEHECIIFQAAHIGPGAVLAGNVSVGTRTFIGANAVIKQGVKIGKDAIVGAGAVVINDIPNNAIVVGNPAKPIKLK